jgi:hypothetical protein
LQAENSFDEPLPADDVDRARITSVLAFVSRQQAHPKH